MHKILGSYEPLYDVLNVISFFVLLIFNLTQLKQKYNIKNISLICIISCVQYLPSTFLNFKFGNLVGTGANYFGLLFFIPYILLLFCYLIKVDPLKQIDLITPAFPLALTISKSACFCAGCCRGVESSFGLYNYNTGLIEFPVQLLEASLAFLIFIFLMFWRKKAKIGTMFPTYLILFSATRFFSEFLRVEPNIIGRLKTYHILCIIGVIVGVVELILVTKFGNKIRKICDRKISLKDM